MSLEIPDIDDDVRVDTFTETDVGERRELLEAIDDLEARDVVSLIWHSRRAKDGRVAAVATVEKNLGAKVLFDVDERETDIYLDVRPNQLTNRWHAPAVAYSTGKRHTSREPRLGELVDIKSIEEGEE